MPKFKSSSDIPAPTHMLGCLPHPLASWGLCVGFRRLNSTAPPPKRGQDSLLMVRPESL